MAEQMPNCPHCGKSDKVSSNSGSELRFGTHYCHRPKCPLDAYFTNPTDDGETNRLMAENVELRAKIASLEQSIKDAIARLERLL